MSGFPKGGDCPAEMKPTGFQILTEQERAELTECESIIEGGVRVFLEVGAALVRIRDGRLYRTRYRSFDEYCRVRWGMSRVHADRTIRSLEVAANLSGSAVEPTTERQLRPLAGQPTEVQRAAWTAAVASCGGGRPSGEAVARAVQEIAPKPQVTRKAAPSRGARRVDPDLDEAIAPEPPDIRAQREAGIIPAGVEVEVYDPFGFIPHAEDGPTLYPEEDGMDMPGELNDAEFLARCPIREDLDDACRSIFDQDALLYRDIETAKRSFHLVAAPLLKKLRRRGKVGPYHRKLTRFFKASHPKHWKVCPDCNGTGRHVFVGKCPTCHECGYLT